MVALLLHANFIPDSAFFRVSLSESAPTAASEAQSKRTTADHCFMPRRWPELAERQGKVEQRGRGLVKAIVAWSPEETYFLSFPIFSVRAIKAESTLSQHFKSS